jgi:hypothetical protein
VVLYLGSVALDSGNLALTRTLIKKTTSYLANLEFLLSELDI